MNERLRIVLLSTAAILVYANTLLNSFTYDDFPYILNNPAVTHPSIKGFFEATRGSNLFRPFTFATFALNWALGNVHAFGYHVFNLLAHAAVTVLLYFVLRRLLENVPRAKTITFVAALLFAVHPIHTEAVASIAGRAELLAAVFLLSAWLFHLRDRPVPGLVCFVLAMMSKESAVALVPLALAGDYLRGKLKPMARYGWIAIVALLYVGVLWIGQGGRFGEVSISFADNPLAKLPAIWRILNALHVAWKYIGLQIYPAALCCDYSYNAIKTYLSWQHTLPAAIAALAAVALWAWAMWTRQTGWALAGAIYLAGFSVTANILIPTGTIMGERLAYLPSAGFCLLVVLVWIKLANQQSALAWSLLVVLVIALGVRTVERNRDWRSNFTLFSATLRAAPESARAHSNMGVQYLEQGKLDLASTEFRTTLRIFPDFPDALEYYGIILSRQGHNEEALQLLERAFSLTQKRSLAYDFRAVNLAAHLVKIGQDQEASKILDNVIAEDSNDTRAWSNRAVVQYRRGKLESARSDAEAALQLDPGNMQARSVLKELNKPTATPVR